MSDNHMAKLKTILLMGGIVGAIISLLISLFLIYLSRFSFICLDPDLCNRADKPLITNQP